MEEMIRELNYLQEQAAFLNGVLALMFLFFIVFLCWCAHVYVTSKRDWFEEDIKIRNSERSYNLARAEQIRLESLALRDRLEKSGVDTKEKEFI